MAYILFFFGVKNFPKILAVVYNCEMDSCNFLVSRFEIVVDSLDGHAYRGLLFLLSTGLFYIILSRGSTSSLSHFREDYGAASVALM